MAIVEPGIDKQSSQMKARGLHWFAVVLILVIGLQHVLAAQIEYTQAPYIGYLFVANFVGALVAAYVIYHRVVWGWLLGLLIAVASMAGYLWSRTLGMPAMNVQEWFTPYGVIAVTAEVLFIVLALLRPWRLGVDANPPVASSWRRLIPPVLAILVAVAVGYSASIWDAAVTEASTIASVPGMVPPVADLIKTRATTFNELEAQYGVRVTLVGLTAMDSIIDVRVKIDDPEKAHLLLDNHAALLVNNQSLILAPRMHSHGKLKQGVQYVMFFPNSQGIIRPGTPVSVIFGNLRTENILAQ